MNTTNLMSLLVTRHGSFFRAILAHDESYYTMTGILGKVRTAPDVTVDVAEYRSYKDGSTTRWFTATGSERDEVEVSNDTRWRAFWP